MFALTRLTFERARKERLPQVAGSLTFTTLLSMVPLLAVSLALIARFPVFRRLKDALEHVLLGSLLPADIARTVLKYLNKFAINAHGLTWVGSLFLLCTAVAMLLTVENALNQMWQVRRNRPFLRRVGMYLLMLALGPLMLGVVALASLFYFVPNTTVQLRDALVGGVIASVGFELGKRGFTHYLVKVPTYKAVYGAFATLPMFLLWVYFSWLVTLVAAMTTANLALARRRPGGRLARA